MGFRYRKTKSVAPGVKVNLNKKSASVRFGGKNAGVTFNTNGKVTRSAKIPNTGLSYTDSENIFKNSNKSNHTDSSIEYSDSSIEKDSVDKAIGAVKGCTTIFLVVTAIVLFAAPIILVSNLFKDDETKQTTTELKTELSDRHEATTESTTEFVTEFTTELQTELTTKIESVTKKQVPASTKSETQKPTEKKNPPAQQNTPKTGTYTLNTKTGKYHYPNCGTLKNANAENLTEISFDQTGNYSPCKKCNPPQA